MQNEKISNLQPPFLQSSDMQAKQLEAKITILFGEKSENSKGLKQTFTFLGRDFAIFNTFTWQNPCQESESWF